MTVFLFSFQIVNNICKVIKPKPNKQNYLPKMELKPWCTVITVNTSRAQLRKCAYTTQPIISPLDLNLL